jgi:hypothetical protein
MKRLCLILAFLFLFTQTSSALLLPTPQVVYRGTITGLRISAVDGTAFIDNAGATIPTYADGNHQIEIYDSSNRMLKGVLKAAGTGETTGSDLLTGLDISSGWTAIGTPATTINDADTYTANSTSSGVRKFLWTLGALYKGFLTVSITGTSTYTFLGRNPNDMIIAGAGTQHKTVSIDTAVYIATIGTTTGTVTDILTASLSQVTAPSSSGATITTLKNGDVYNWSYKNSSFSFNSASYYVIIRAIR